MISLNKKLQLNKEIVSHLQESLLTLDPEKKAVASCLLYSCRTVKCTENSCKPKSNNIIDNKKY